MKLVGLTVTHSLHGCNLDFSTVVEYTQPVNRVLSREALLCAGSGDSTTSTGLDLDKEALNSRGLAGCFSVLSCSVRLKSHTNAHKASSTTISSKRSQSSKENSLLSKAEHDLNAINCYLISPNSYDNYEELNREDKSSLHTVLVLAIIPVFVVAPSRFDCLGHEHI